MRRLLIASAGAVLLIAIVWLIETQAVEVGAEPNGAMKVRDGRARAFLGERSLDPIDLSSEFRVLDIDVLDDAGTPRDGAVVTLSNRVSGYLDRGKRTRNGRATFVIAAQPLDVYVDCDGFRSARLPNVTDDAVVRLKPGIPVTVQLLGSFELPPEPYELVISLYAKQPIPRVQFEGLAPARRGSPPTFRVSAAGSFEVAWFVAKPDLRRYLPTTARQVVRVLDQEEDQVVEIVVGPDVRPAWEQALREIAEGK